MKKNTPDTGSASEPLREPRPSPEEYYMSLAVQIASRCNCMKTHVGAIILRDGRIRTAGYNGTVEGYADCFKGGCPRCKDLSIHSGQKLDHCICVHAEENALVSAARYGIPVDGADCYVTHEPCLSCTKLLIQSHVKRVIYLVEYDYPDQPEQNSARQSMREHSKGQKDGAEFCHFADVAADHARAKELMTEWSEKLAGMKSASLDYAKKIGVC